MGIRGMAQALHDANDSASSVALNADLTVSLSALVLKTLALVDPTAETPELGSREDARARQLTDPRAVIKDTCTLAEPLFEAETPLVLRNRLPANELRFIPRDVLSCCLFALLHRAGTRILRGECAMAVDKTRDVAMDSTASTLIARSVASGSIFDHPGGAHRPDSRDGLLLGLPKVRRSRGAATRSRRFPAAVLGHSRRGGVPHRRRGTKRSQTGRHGAQVLEAPDETGGGIAPTRTRPRGRLDQS